MTNVNISELNSDGSELFLDSENYLGELSEQELAEVFGGVVGKTLALSTLLTSLAVKAYRESQDPSKLSLPTGSDGIDVGTSALPNISSFTGTPASSFTNAGSYSF